jgi:hypothetical protein
VTAAGTELLARIPCAACGGQGNLGGAESGGLRASPVGCPAGCDGGWVEVWVPVGPRLLELLQDHRAVSV